MCHYVDKAGTGSAEGREMSEGNRRKEDYFTKFTYMKFRFMIVPARFIKKVISSFIKI